MTTALLHRFSAFLRCFCAFVFAVATTQCGGEQPNSIYYINVLDAPPEVHQYIGTQLFINDKFVKLSESGKIIPSKTQDEKKAAFKTNFIYFAN